MAFRAIPLGTTGETVRANIEALRRARGLSTAALARKLADAGRPIENTGVWRITNGGRHVDVDDLVAFAAVFDVAPEKLLAPFECGTCQGKPPVGFACLTCGTQGGAP